MTNKLDLSLKNTKFIESFTHKNELKRSIAEENDLLISIAGTLGRIAVVRRMHLPCNMNQAISLVRLVSNHVYIEYLKYLIASPDIQELMMSKNKTTAQPNLTLEIISNLLIPIPPLEEQKRIVAKVDAIMNYLDILEKEIE